MLGNIQLGTIVRSLYAVENCGSHEYHPLQPPMVSYLPGYGGSKGSLMPK